MNKLDELETNLNKEIVFIEDLKDLIPQYVINVKKDVILLKSALVLKDTQSINSVAHRIKGSALSYGFPAIDLMMKVLEESSGDLKWKLIRKCIDDLEVYLTKIEKKIKAF